METFLIYSLKSSCCLTVGFMMYYILFRHSTLHRTKRFVLLGIILFSILIPALNFRLNTGIINIPVNEKESEFISAARVIIINQINTAPIAQPKNFRLMNIPLLIFIAGVSGRVFFLLIASGRMLAIFRKAKKIKYEGCRIAFLPENISPFCFGRYIMISGKDFEEHKYEIIRHEQTHLKAKHGLDLIIIELYLAITWYNPVSWLFRSELKQNHEFDADVTVLQDFNAPEYQLLLIKKAVGESRFRLANQFNQHNIKKRIKMMNRKKSNPLGALKVLLFVPLIAMMVQVSAQKEIISTSAFGETPKQGKFIELNTDQLKALGFVWNTSGLYYKNQRADTKDKNITCLYFTDNTYSASIILSKGEKAGKRSSGEKFLRKQKLTNFDFYPVAVTDYKGSRTLDMTSSLKEPGIDLFPVQINMGVLDIANRADTLVFWFKSSETLKKILLPEIRIESFLQPCPEEPQQQDLK